MNVLVTGSNGFIGRHVVSWLRKEGMRVFGLDLSPESRSDCHEYTMCDIDSEATATVLDTFSERIDAVVHLAADMRREPHNIEVVQANCVGTQRLLEACEAAGVKAFAQLSSLPVIGKPTIIPITEDHPLEPPTVYHATKRTEELLADYAYRMHGLRSCSFRISAPVGIGVNPKTIFPTFVRNAVSGQDLTLAGKGGRRQTYIHVNDIAQAIEKALLSTDAAGVFNLSSYNRLSNLELANACISTLGSSSRIVFTGADDPMEDYDWSVSIEKVRTAIGYEPRVSIEEAIVEYADHLRQTATDGAL